MIVSFFAFNGATMQPMGATSENFETLDDCIYKLVQLQEHNSPEFFAVAGCMQLEEDSSDL